MKVKCLDVLFSKIVNFPTVQGIKKDRKNEHSNESRGRFFYKQARGTAKSGINPLLMLEYEKAAKKRTFDLLPFFYERWGVKKIIQKTANALKKTKPSEITIDEYGVVDSGELQAWCERAEVVLGLR
ncbi:MAG: hypothetical protein WCO84_03510 [bacterium]